MINTQRSDSKHYRRLLKAF